MSIKTSIPKLDDITNGGLPEGLITIFWSKPGIENAPFVYQTIIENLKAGYSVAYLINNKTADLVRNDIKNYGWDLKKFENKKKLVFIDAYSKIISNVSREKLVVEKPKDIKSISKKIFKAFDLIDGKKKILVIDDLSTIFDLCGECAISDLKEWKKEFTNKKITSLFLFTEWPYNKKLLSDLKKDSDLIVKLNAVEEKVILRKYYSVIKGGKTGKGRGVPFEILEPGGIRVYIPKILITGPYNAGKSSFVHTASVKSVSVDRIGTTIALDHGHVDYAGFSLDLFGTPGQERFDPILKMLGGQSLGVIVVVDSTSPETFPRAKEMLSKTRSVGLPFVIAANKYDLPGALKTKEILEVFGFDKNVKIIPIRAKNLKQVKKGVKAVCELRKEDVHKVFDELFNSILQI